MAVVEYLVTGNILCDGWVNDGTYENREGKGRRTKSSNLLGMK